MQRRIKNNKLIPVKQNRLLLIKDITRLSKEELLDAQLKLHLYLSALIDKHNIYYVRYFMLMITSIRTMLLFQNNPKREKLVKEAELELYNSNHTKCPNRHFSSLIALTIDYAESLKNTSRSFIAECDGHARAVVTIQTVKEMLLQPEWVFGAFGEVCSGNIPLSKVAEKHQISDDCLNKHVLDMASLIYKLYASQNSELKICPSKIQELQQQHDVFMKYFSMSKIFVQTQMSKIVSFNNYFGKSLIDKSELNHYLSKDLHSS